MEITPFVRRPSVGREGRPIKVRTNLFEVITMPTNNIIHYDVSITPEVPPRLNMKIFESFVNQYRERALGNARPVFDGRKNMLAHKLLPFGDAATFNVTLEERTPVASRRPPREFRIRIRRVGDIVMGELFQFLRARSRMTNNCQTAIMALDAIIGHKVSTLHVAVGRSFFTPEGSRSISGGAEVWQGYYQSARPTSDKMMINIDLSATAFYEGGRLVQIVAKILELRSPDDLRRGLSEREHQKVERKIRNLKIRVNHRAEARTSSKIERLTQTPASRTMFEKDGNTIDVATYFQNTYNMRLIYPFLPCVIVRRNVFLPLEVCDVIPGQRHMRKLDGKQVDEMMNFTRQNPTLRANKIRAGLNILDYRNDEYMQQFGVRVSNEMAMVDGRILPTPTIHYHPSSRDNRIRPAGGVWNLRDKKVATGATLGSWCVLAFLSPDVLPDHDINAFVRELANTCQDTGMNIPNKNPPILHANPQGNIEESLKQAWLRAGNSAKAQPQLILCILPNTGQPLYAEIKRVSDTVIGVATQCVQNRYIRQTKKQYCANVCLKINVKLGGMNSFIDPTQIPFISDRPTILMGADVTHPAPGPGSDERPSIAAVTASVDAKASRYAASIRIQRGRTEIIADLANMVKELLKAFYQTCGRKPERILFYRDGISESQFGSIITTEIAAIKAACQALDANYKPTITFVVVQKRHHTRFFPIDRRDADRTGNCPPGTVIETVITHPFEFDFYLQSHAGLLGTSRPAHYYVLYDDNGFNPDMLQTLSYNLCYIYARCTRSVSLVPPVYYAHLVTNRAKLHARGGPFSDTGSEEGGGAAVTFGVVKPELQRVMYFA
ncbi:Piwi-domain-containing protein [Rhizophagus irregularis]|uniref:Piwi-domain-containing protein n=1 Tax=Rhizophagus irregularis TaxID=588596 RepID=A0A2N1N279_9GLOM|nr:Piwi-domain-containing protein [Rhizophagus irregularis]